MKMMHIIAVCFFIAGAAAIAQAQESECAAYFIQDIHNKFVVIDNATGKQVATSSLCKKEAQSSASGFSVQYAGFGVGFDQASAIASAICDNRFSESDFSRLRNVYQSVVDPGIVQASLECFKLYAKGLHQTVHSDADTHSVTISMSYNGPQSIAIKDIVLYGNIKCEGQLYTAWNQKKTVPLDTKVQAISCSAKDPIDPKSPRDIEAGSINIITDAGPIYAQIPRRFAPSLEEEFRQIQTIVASMQTDLRGVISLLSKHLLAAAVVRGGKLQIISEGASLDIPTGKFSFKNPANLKYIPLLSAIARNGQFLTESCYTRALEVDKEPNSFVVWQGAQDTSGRNHPPEDCTIAVIAIGK